MLRLFYEPTQWQSSKKFLAIIDNIVVIFTENGTCFRLFSLHLFQIWSVISIANITNKWAQSGRPTVDLYASAGRWRTDGHKFDGKVHLTSLWPWPLTSDLESLFNNCQLSLIWWIFMASFVEISTQLGPTEISPHAKYGVNGRLDFRRYDPKTYQLY